MILMDLLAVQDIRVIALKAIIDPDPDDWLRHVYRTFSQKYHTPLHEVEKLPLLWVLQHYYESKFEEMDENELLYLAKTTIFAEADKTISEENDAAFMERVLQEEHRKEKERKAAAAINRAKAIKTFESDSLQAVESISKLAKGLEGLGKKIKGLPDKIPEDVNLEFGDSGLDIPSMPTERKPLK